MNIRQITRPAVAPTSALMAWVTATKTAETQHMDTHRPSGWAASIPMSPSSTIQISVAWPTPTVNAGR